MLILYLDLIDRGKHTQYPALLNQVGFHDLCMFGYLLLSFETRENNPAGCLCVSVMYGEVLHFGS